MTAYHIGKCNIRFKDPQKVDYTNKRSKDIRRGFFVKELRQAT
jgi:hypothetical protein